MVDDPLDAEAAQGALAALARIAGTVVEGTPVLTVLAHDAKLGGDYSPSPPGREKTPDQRLVVVGAMSAVSSRSMPRLHHLRQHPQGRLIVRRPVNSLVHPHAAQPQGETCRLAPSVRRCIAFSL